MDYNITPKKGKNRHIKIEQVYDDDNIRRADKEARKGKSKKYGPMKFDKNKETNLQELRTEIMDGSYQTMSPIFEERFCDTKVRVLSKVYYKYHVAHHAFMQVILDKLITSYYYDSAAAIKGRGIHYAKKHVEKYLRKHPNWKIYHCQLDFKKFYHYIDRQKLYNRFCKTFTNKGIRWLAHDVIWCLRESNGLTESDGKHGVGIGLYPVQPLVNFYLNDLGREIIKITNIKFIEYCDNLLLMSPSKASLEQAIKLIIKWANHILEQPIHKNIGIQLLNEDHPISFVGYKFYQNKTFVRNNIKNNFIFKFKTCKGYKLRQVLVAYRGWFQWSNSLGLWKKITHMNSYKGFSTKPKKKKTIQNHKKI